MYIYEEDNENNDEKDYTREIGLISYLPPYMQNYIEMQKIIFSENPEFDLAWERAEKLRKDIFVETAELAGVKMFERMLSLSPRSTDTLEVRKERILARIMNIPPYTLKRFKEMLEEIYGKGNVLIELFYDIYEMNIELLLDKEIVNAESLLYLSRTIIPANIKYFLFASIPKMTFTNENNFITSSFGFNGNIFFYGDRIVKLNGKYMLDGKFILNQEFGLTHAENLDGKYILDGELLLNQGIGFVKHFRFKELMFEGYSSSSKFDNKLCQSIFIGINISNEIPAIKQGSFAFGGLAQNNTYDDFMIKLRGGEVLNGSWLLEQKFVKHFGVNELNFNGISVNTKSKTKLSQSTFDGISLSKRKSDIKPTFFVFSGLVKNNTTSAKNLEYKELHISGFRSENSCSFKNVELIKDSMWQLGGTDKLDGFRKLNADTIKEVI